MKADAPGQRDGGDPATEPAAPVRVGNQRLTPAESGTIQSVRRATRLLSLFAADSTDRLPRRTQWSVSDLARATGLHKSVVARLMATMAQAGFVIQDPVSKAYSIGPEAFAVGSAYEPYTVLNHIARPVMESLTRECGHASHLGVPAADHFIFLIGVESIRSIRVSIEVGERRHYHAGAIGKALLAGLSDKRIREIVGPDPLPKITPYTIGSVAPLLAEIDEVRRTGIAYNRQESILGAGSIAVAIQDARGERVAGLGIVFPIHVVSDREIQELAATVAAAGQEIESRLRLAPQRAGVS
jgi:IclR family acetate operon transcriptional repressor